MSSKGPEEPEATADGERRLIDLAIGQAEPSPDAAAETPRSPHIALKPPDPNSPVYSIPGFEILHEIQRGGQGVVYQAIQKSTHRRVAIKVMREGPFSTATDRARFEREVRILAQLRHPNIVTIHDSGVAAGHAWFVMDYISGKPLDRHLLGDKFNRTNVQASTAARPSLPAIRETLELFAVICDAVEAAHRRGIIHRDLKPGNIRVDTEGRPHVLDFGLARPTGIDSSTDSQLDPVSITGIFVGSLSWASPEQAEGIPERIDARTDVYALGMMLYQMLTGVFPYDVDSGLKSTLDNILTAEPVPLRKRRADIDAEVDTIILKCIAKQPEARYQTAGELGDDIRHYLAGEPIEARRTSHSYLIRSRVKRFVRRRPMTSRVVILLIAAVLAQSIAGPIVFDWLMLDQWFGRIALSALANRPFERVRVVAIENETKLEQLAHDEGIEGVDERQFKSVRKLHARLIRRLADLGARVIVLDIVFPESPFDEDLANAIATIDGRGVPTVIAAPDWVPVGGIPEISPLLLARTRRWGPIMGDFPATGPWAIELILRRGPERWPSLALAAAAAMIEPLDTPDYEFDVAEWRARIILKTTQPGLPNVPKWSGEDRSIRLTNVEHEEKADGNILPGDVKGYFTVKIPGTSAIEKSTLSYESIFRREDDARLRAELGGRAVVVGNLRHSRSSAASQEGPSSGPTVEDDYSTYMDGREVSKCYSQAAAIDSILAEQLIRNPRDDETWIAVFAAAALGLVPARTARWRHRLILLIGLTVAIIVICLGTFWASGYLCTPFVPIAAMLGTCELAAWYDRHIPPNWRSTK